MKNSNLTISSVKLGMDWYKCSLHVVAMILLAFGAWLAFYDKTASSIGQSGFAIILLCIANIDRFASFKAFGLEATTKLDQIVDEASDIKTQLEKDVVEAQNKITDVIAKNEQLTQSVAGLDAKVAELNAMIAEAQQHKDQINQIYNQTKINFDSTEDLRLQFNKELERMQSQMDFHNTKSGII